MQGRDRVLVEENGTPFGGAGGRLAVKGAVPRSVVPPALPAAAVRHGACM